DNVQLHLVEVLNKFGLGTAHTVITGLARFWQYLNDTYGTELAKIPVVINASLKFDVPLAVDDTGQAMDLSTLADDELSGALTGIDPKLDPTRSDTYQNFIWQSLNAFRHVAMSNEALAFWRDDHQPEKDSPQSPIRLLIGAAGNDRDQTDANKGIRPRAG